MTSLPKLTIGEKVRQGREQLGLTREDFAREVGTSTSTIARIELSGQLPKVAVLAAIAARLGVSIDELVEQRASA